MGNDNAKILSSNLISYSVNLQPGEVLYLELVGKDTLDLGREIVTEATRIGGIPFWYYNDEYIQRRWFFNFNEEQIKKFGQFHLKIMKEADAYISIRGIENRFQHSDVPREQMKLYNQYFYKPVHFEERVKNTRWCVLRYPNNAMAQMAEKSQEEFEEFYYSVCNLDYARMSKAMNPLVSLMGKTDKVQIVSPGTDLTFSIKDIPIVKCDGKCNIPDGEVYTAPVRESINGHITFNTPCIYEGNLFQDIRLDFQDGKIIHSTASTGEERLNQILDTDEGARYVGEFSIGINPNIKTPMCDTLFDEKIFGSIHLTPGNCYDEAPNGNESAIHWDLVLIQTKEYGGGEILFDDCPIRKDGLFIHPELKETLSAENLLKTG
jgi:aminopeptidase